MDLDALSDSAQNYLKSIYTFGEWHTESMTPSALADYLGLSRSTVSEHVRRLSKQGLVEHSRQGGVALTPLGRDLAVRMVRRHRLIESFLSHALGYSWEEIHDDAERLEHGASDLFLGRIDAALGYPERDPHGDPIPRSDGTIPPTSDVPLLSLPAGAQFRVARVRDRQPGLLNHFANLGIVPGARGQVNDRGTTTHAVSLSLEDAREAVLAHDSARSVLVVLVHAAGLAPGTPLT
ncbi:metal-dependent transcriptional regulator [Corynebacterium capitovis]|uniref:metal-dependent transcriptional regulator n=1 Tax=Corynebacterium capitovis TaxID=131081 RepID=UPI00036601D6|nr:metal-dependent transcriptional regulator [Corynebacterium capitovis]